ncbi:MAG: AAA family ATPase [Gemmatimonadaceae bacterium]
MPNTESSYRPTHGALRLLIFGAPRLVVHSDDSREHQLLAAGKPVALLAYLQLAPRRTASAERLSDLLWGNRKADTGLKALRQTIWLIKQQVGDGVIERIREGVSLLRPIASDLADFESHIRAGELDHALTLYTGEFFADFASPGAAQFEEWADLVRARARRLYIDAAELLAQREMNSGRPDRAVAIARRVREVDPHGETGWRLLLEALVSAADFAAARAEVEQFNAWQHANGRHADPSSAALIRAVQRASRPAPGAVDEVDVVADLIGRDHEFGAICHLWSQTVANGAMRAHITADAGLGKSRLLLDVAARLAALRARVLVHRANVGERHLPFSTMAALAARLAALPGARGISTESARALLALNPSLSYAFDQAPDPSTGDEALRRRGLAILELIGAVADETPLALMIDDLHWCDDASASILGLVAGSLRQEHVLLVTTARPHYAMPDLPDDTLRLSLAPLDAQQVHALVASMGELPGEPWARDLPDQLAKCARGNPLMLLEALRLCRDHGVLHLNSRRWACTDAPALAELLNVDGVIRHRLHGISPAEEHLLLVMALAGLPLPKKILVASAGLPEHETDAAIAALERRGFVNASPNDVRVAHDEIGYAAISDVDDAASRRAHLALGDTMAGADEAVWRRRAVGHLLLGGDDAHARAVVRGELAAAPRGAELDAEIRALLGRHATPQRVAQVRASLPLSARYPRGWRRAAVAATAVVLFGAGGAVAAVLREQAPPDAILLVGATDGRGQTAVDEIPIRATDLDDPAPLVIPTPRSGTHWRHFIDTEDAWRPGTREWAGQEPDSTGTHVEIRGQDGDHLQLNFSNGDDLPLGFSPDGKQLLVVTSRWRTGGALDLAVVNVASRAIRRLASSAGDSVVNAAAWSPDGSRIAFTRLAADQHASLWCVIAVDGFAQRCTAISAPVTPAILGWLDDHRILIRLANTDGTSQCATVDVDSGDEKALALGDVADASLDPSGKFLLVRRAGRGNRPAMSIVSLDRPNRDRDIAFADPGTHPVLHWGPAAAPAPFIARLALQFPAAPLQPHVPYMLAARAWNSDDTPAELTTLQWRSLTPGIARIDSMGVLVASDTGMAVIQASAGGWRTTVDSIRIAQSPPRLALDERWTGNVTSRWRYFGQPLPRIVAEPSGQRAFMNNGDGKFFSGAYYLPMFDARHGLAVDVDLSEPLTETKWQLIQILVSAGRDSARLAAWDHRTGYNLYIPGPGCGFGYPMIEGVSTALSATPVGNWATATGDSTLRLGSGAWFHIRLQILPDGRCGIALNGKPLYIGPPAAIAVPTITLELQGNSVDTQILVGHVRVVQGVPDDMDWTQLPYTGGVWRATPVRHWPRVESVPDAPAIGAHRLATPTSPHPAPAPG